MCLVHHAHTDIGYTDLQSVIRRRHVHFLDEALHLIRRMRDGDASLQGFVWTVECFWSLEQWLRQAAADRQAELASAIRDGHIGLSGTYLHYTELADAELLEHKLRVGAAYANSIGVPLDTAVSADINGFGWGYAQKLHDAGIRNLLVCLHSHHGMAPIGRRQAPFLWETPQGDEVMVWLNEHYMLGNILGLAPGALLNYAFADELQPRPATPANGPVAETRLFRYLRRLEEDGYPADFVPIHVAGLATDNAPPSGEIARFANEWNGRHGAQVRIELTTPSSVAARIRRAFPNMPSYRGDWPDWWSDGVASAPAATRLCRQAQRGLRYLRLLDQSYGIKPALGTMEEAEDAISLYCEHTFNHSAAMLAPWDLACKAVGAGKSALAATAYHLVEEAIGEALDQRGPGVPSPGTPFLYRAINPLPTEVRDVARLALEYQDCLVHDLALVVRDPATGRVLPHQKSDSVRGFTVDVRLDLPAGGQVELEILPGAPTLPHVGRQFCDSAQLAMAGSDVVGAEPARALLANDRVLESTRVRIAFEPGQGIVSWFDKVAGCELLRDGRTHAPFLPVYDVTPVTPRHDGNSVMARNANITTRGRMGRNRKGPDARHYPGQLCSAQVLPGGPLSSTVQLDYACEGCEFYRVLLTAWADLPRVDVSVRLLKQAVWEPENLYLALPFASGAAVGRDELWVEKAGTLVRPWHDQLPDSLADFSCVQDGVVWQGKGRGLVITTPDAPLLQLGPLQYGPRHLMGSPALAGGPAQVYSWLMTNYWETNFEATPAGFHEFNFRVEWGPHVITPETGHALCRALNHGIRSFRCRRTST